MLMSNRSEPRVDRYTHVRVDKEQSGETRVFSGSTANNATFNVRMISVFLDHF